MLGFGQNHPIRAMASGTLPHTIAQGVNIEPMKRMAVATAAMNGQIDGSGVDSLKSALPWVMVETICSRLSTLRPDTTGRLSRLAQSGSRFVTTGTRSKFWGSGGDAAAHSRVPAFQGLGPATGPRRALETMLLRKRTKLPKNRVAPRVEMRLRFPQPISGR